MASMMADETDPLTSRATQDAAEAARHAGVEIRPLEKLIEARASARLFSDLWKEPFPEYILRALQLSGNYVVGAYAPDGGALIGASAGWLSTTTSEAGNVEPELHSHITGVDPTHRRSGVGLAMKLHQRAWALQRGIGAITWTFDPLVKRNAAFNLVRLAASPEAYLEDVYDEANPGAACANSDRIWLRWDLDDAAVTGAAGGSPRWVEAPVGAMVRLAAGEDGRPVVTEDSGPGPFRCEMPADVEALRASDPEAAYLWRLAVREVVGGALASGGRVLGLDRAGAYLVEPSPAAS
jgi:predicted GNAT superfamily acetyltransferase